MPTPRDQLPADPATLARRIRDLERAVTELRAARRLPHSAMSTGAVQLVDASGAVLAEMTPHLGDRAAFAAYDERLDQRYYGALTGGDVRFGIVGVTDRSTEAALSYSDLGDRYEALLTSGRSPESAEASVSLLSESAPTSEDSSVILSGSTVVVTDLLRARSIAAGKVTITPAAANTPTAVPVTGLNVAGTSFQAVATPLTGVPGTTVTGVGVSALTSGGLTVWLTRTNTTPTDVYWMVIGS